MYCFDYLCIVSSTRAVRTQSHCLARATRFTRVPEPNSYAIYTPLLTRLTIQTDQTEKKPTNQTRKKKKEIKNISIFFKFPVLPSSVLAVLSSSLRRSIAAGAF